jgi:hypothetical protein
VIRVFEVNWIVELYVFYDLVNRKGGSILKTLDVSKLCLVAGLVVALFVAYGVATPKSFLGAATIGGDCNCGSTGTWSCSSGGSACSGFYNSCLTPPGPLGTCEDVGPACSGTACSMPSIICSGTS